MTFRNPLPFPLPIMRAAGLIMSWSPNSISNGSDASSPCSSFSSVTSPAPMIWLKIWKISGPRRNIPANFPTAAFSAKPVPMRKKSSPASAKMSPRSMPSSARLPTNGIFPACPRSTAISSAWPSSNFSIVPTSPLWSASTKPLRSPRITAPPNPAISSTDF